MGIVILKTVITVCLILCLTLIAERSSPRVAGVLSGYPIGSALVLFIYGVQIGPSFAAASVPYNLMGHASALAFVFFYFLGARDSTVGSVLGASALGLGGYVLTAWSLSLLEPSLISGAAVSGTSIALFTFLFRKIPEASIDHPVRCSPAMLVFRLALSTVIVLAITGFAREVGLKWAGLFSAFPLVVYPLVLIIHLNYGDRSAHCVLKNFPRGLWSVMVYSLTVSLTYERMGVVPGTAAGYLAATVLLFAVNWRVFGKDRPAPLSLDKLWEGKVRESQVAGRGRLST